MSDEIKTMSYHKAASSGAGAASDATSLIENYDATGTAGIAGTTGASPFGTPGDICFTPAYLPSFAQLPTMELDRSPPSSPTTVARRAALYPRPSPSAVEEYGDVASRLAVQPRSSTNELASATRRAPRELSVGLASPFPTMSDSDDDGDDDDADADGDGDGDVDASRTEAEAEVEAEAETKTEAEAEMEMEAQPAAQVQQLAATAANAPQRAPVALDDQFSDMYRKMAASYPGFKSHGDKQAQDGTDVAPNGGGGSGAVAATDTTSAGTGPQSPTRPKMGKKFQLDLNPTILYRAPLANGKRSGDSGSNSNSSNEDDLSGGVDSSAEESGADSGGETSWGTEDEAANSATLPAAAICEAEQQKQCGPAIELTALPAELLWKVLGFLPLFEVIQARAISRVLQEAADAVLCLPVSWAQVESYAVGCDPSDYVIEQVCSRAALVFQHALSTGAGVAGAQAGAAVAGAGSGANLPGEAGAGACAEASDAGAGSANIGAGRRNGTIGSRNMAALRIDPARPWTSGPPATAAAAVGGHDDVVVDYRSSLLMSSTNAARLPFTTVDATEGGVDVSDACLVAAAILGATLHTLVLDGCSWITDVGLRAVSTSCSELRVLSLQLCHNVTDYALAMVAEGCPSLEKLSLSHNFDVTDHGLRSIAKGCPNVAALSLKNLPRISPSGLTVGVTIQRRPMFDADAALAVQLQAQMDGVSPDVLADMQRERQSRESSTVVVDIFAFGALECLDVISCDNIDDELAEVLLRGPGQVPGAVLPCTQQGPDNAAAVAVRQTPVEALTRLSVEGCCSITDHFFTAIAPHSSALAQLSVAKCYLLTDATTAALTLAAPAGLTVIDVSFCPAISGKGVLELAAACPQLRRICVVDCSGVSRVDQRALESNNIQCYRSTFGAF